MKGVIVICLFIVAAFKGYGQHETVIKGTGPTGTPVEYHLLRSTVTASGVYKQAVVRKVFVNDSSSRMLHFKVDCNAHTYNITKNGC